MYIYIYIHACIRTYIYCAFVFVRNISSLALFLLRTSIETTTANTEKGMRYRIYKVE